MEAAEFSLGHRPELTLERVMQVFRDQFKDVDGVEFVSVTPGFWAGKNPSFELRQMWRGVSVTLKQEKRDTKLFLFSSIKGWRQALGFVPFARWWFRVSPLGADLFKEVRAFVDSNFQAKEKRGLL